MLFTSAKTDQGLLDRLATAARKPLSPDTIRKQRVSFVYGNLPLNSEITKEAVERQIAENEGGGERR